MTSNRSETSYPLVGAGVIAVAFGFARFAHGQFVPAMRADLGLDATTIGLIAAQPFVGFCIACAGAARAVERLGPCRAAVAVLLVGCAGLAVMATATSALALAAGALICGLSTGASMPALSAGARVRIPTERLARTEATMNAGTSAGVALVAPIAVLVTDAWRSAYGLFAVAALALLPAVRYVVPREGHAPRAIGAESVSGARERSEISRLAAFAFLMGFAATPFWLFAPERVRAGDPGQIALLWAVLGLGGLVAGAVGDLASRIGDRRTHASAAVLVACASGLAATTGEPMVLLPGAAAFGLGYMALTGIYLVTGVHILRRRPALGPVVPFFAVAAGQAVGSAAAGFGVDHVDHAWVMVAGAGGAVLLVCAGPLYPARGEPRSEARSAYSRGSS